MIEPLLEAQRALDAGRLDQAERLYRGVAEADPRSAIAVVGLSRVALGRGEEAKALVLARRAAEIDPANPMAARMVARLEEVLAERGRAAARRAEAAPRGAPPTAMPAEEARAPALVEAEAMPAEGEAMPRAAGGGDAGRVTSAGRGGRRTLQPAGRSRTSAGPAGEGPPASLSVHLSGRSLAGAPPGCMMFSGWAQRRRSARLWVRSRARIHA